MITSLFSLSTMHFIADTICTHTFIISLLNIIVFYNKLKMLTLIYKSPLQGINLKKYYREQKNYKIMLQKY